MDKKIELLDENGDITVFSVIADFRIEGDEYADYEGNEYAILAVDENNDDEGILFKVIEGDELSEPMFSLIDDDREFEMASSFYESLIAHNDEKGEPL